MNETAHPPLAPRAAARAACASAIAGVAFWVSEAPAGGSGPPWTQPGDVPLAAEVRSVHVLQNDEPIFRLPNSLSKRRGAAMGGVNLPVYASRRGHGCQARWALVGPEAWICTDRAEPSHRAPIAPHASSGGRRSGLPFDYHFVGPDGSFGYDHLAEVDVGIPDAELQPGFAVAVVEVASRYGEPAALTSKNLWLPMRDIHPARSPELEGVHIDDGNLARGFTIDDETPTYGIPSERHTKRTALARWTPFVVSERATVRGRPWLRIGEDMWIDARSTRVASPAEPPGGIESGERWIDVDLENQIVVAYEGEKPVYVTLASTGRGRVGTEQATPPGAERIWVKLRTSDMTNLEDTEASRYYAIEEVPWVMFFDRGYGLHGAFWHRSFGRVRSHGCVNLSPRDARWFFDWASPRLPAGWRAVLPTDYDRGTVVRVR